MRRVIEFEVADVMPSEEDVLQRMGTPADAATPFVRELLDEGASRIARIAEPRGLLHGVTKSSFAAIYRGEGRNAPESPLDRIYPEADALALFVGTIGATAQEHVHDAFREGDPALGLVLDAYASEMTNRVAEMLAQTFLSAEDRRPSQRALPYSPGYCGWHVTGQRALFDTVQPIDIRVSLSDSCLMQPLKSVSGVAIVADRRAHRFKPQWTFCNECMTHDCGPRIASTK